MIDAESKLINLLGQFFLRILIGMVVAIGFIALLGVSVGLYEVVGAIWTVFLVLAMFGIGWFVLWFDE